MFLLAPLADPRALASRESGPRSYNERFRPHGSEGEAEMDLDEAAAAFRELVSVIRALRTPGTGCPWDLEQTHETLRPYLIEEAYEVLEAIDRGNDRAFREELGDLLLQVVLHAQLADDRGAFSITEVARGIAEKMVRRHPHVFGSARVSSSAEVLRNWEQIKAAERQAAGESSQAAGLTRLPEGLPALLHAQRVGEKAAKAHLDHRSLAEILGEIRREVAGLEEGLRAVSEGASAAEVARRVPEELRERLGRGLSELLFSLCQLARWLGLGAEDSLRVTTRRFVERFRRMEERAPRPLPELSAQEREAAWKAAQGAEDFPEENS
jgi:XTP/dITP diphosphohydrolase